MDLEAQADQAGILAGEEAVDDHELTSTMPSQPQAIESKFPEWKASGRPPCPKCRKRHFGFCKTPQCKLDLINRDPEESKRQRRRMKKQRQRRKQSTIQRTSAPENTLHNLHQTYEQQSINAFLGAPRDTVLDGGRQREQQSTHTSLDDVSSNNNANSMYAPSSTNWPSSDWDPSALPSGDWPSGDWPSSDWPSGDVYIGHGPAGSTDIRALAGQTSGDVVERGEDLLRQQTTEVVRLFQLQAQRRAGDS